MQVFGPVYDTIRIFRKIAIMKKYLSTVFIILIFNCVTYSQAQYKFIDFKDSQKPGIVYTFSYPEKTVDGALTNKLGKLGYKGKESKGFTMYKNVSMSEIGPGNYDLYFAMDKKSRKEKDMSTVTMLISRGNENFVSDSSDAEIIANGKKFLENLVTGVAAYDLEQQIQAQEDVVKKEEKRLKNYGNEGDDMQKRKKKLEQQIEQNQKDQESQAKEVEKQKQLYENLKARRAH